MRLEALLTEGFGLTDASPLQRAICRVADGLPIGDVLGVEAIRAHFGCSEVDLPRRAPLLMVLIAGVRGGKSLLASCAAAKCALSADLSKLQRHEIARVAVLAPTVDNAQATFRLLVGGMRESADLARLIVDDGADSITIRRPDRRLVEIVVVAAHRGAVTLRSRWLAGVILDEFALFGSEAVGAAVNAEELLRGSLTRLVPGGQAWVVSSPFGPVGPLYDLWRRVFGRPGRTVVVHAPTRALNPAFPAETIEEIRAGDPDVAAREYDAAWVDADTAFLDGGAISSSTRLSPEVLPPVPGITYVAAWDAATRGNSWSLVVTGLARIEGETQAAVALAKQWTGSRVSPLATDEVIAEVRDLVKPYGIRGIVCDQWSIDALRPQATAVGLQLFEVKLSGAAKINAYERLRTMLGTGALELAPVPMLATDLRGIRKRALSDGIRIELPKTPDGRHCDYAPALVLTLGSVDAFEQQIANHAYRNSPEYVEKMARIGWRFGQWTAEQASIIAEHAYDQARGVPVNHEINAARLALAADPASSSDEQKQSRFSRLLHATHRRSQ